MADGLPPLTRAKRAAQRRAAAADEYVAAIVAAHGAGHRVTEIARAVGTTHVAVSTLLKRHAR